MKTTLYNVMEYTETFNILRSVFTTDNKEIYIPGSDIKICNIGFESDIPFSDFINKDDIHLSENNLFTYPLFVPADPESKKVILLLHGLNERSWVKYLVWAYWLTFNTGSYVILFPISFHINRSPALWKDSRAMISVMKNRNSSLGQIDMSSFANIALSSRLIEDPLRFLKSGYQTTDDIIKLVSGIRKGEHEIIPATNKINIFAYSIGAFLAEIILMGNPHKMFTESKLFIFCGGSVFSNMNGVSKLIMDSLAFKRVHNYYLNEFEKTITGESLLVKFLRSNQTGMAFRSMIDLGRFKLFRENILKNLSKQIHSITLFKDTVIPFRGVISTLSVSDRKDIVDIWDFPYIYTHENPFPVFKTPLSHKVDYWFEKVFTKACLFLA